MHVCRSFVFCVCVDIFRWFIWLCVYILIWGCGQPGFSTRDEMANKTYQLLCIIPKIAIYT